MTIVTSYVISKANDIGKNNKTANMSLKAYCEQTSLHGWYYMTSDHTRIMRFIWALIVLSSIGVASVFVYKATEEFTKATVVTTIHSTTEPLSEVYFPAVTVCNINQVRVYYL